MPEALKLEDEAERIAALKSYRILDTHAEQSYDDITRLAATLFNAPMALLSFVAEDRQWSKSAHGISGGSTPRELAFCACAIEEPSPFLIVEDASKDERFKDNPMVMGEPHIRFYAAHQLVDDDGHILGTLCVIDSKPREVSYEEREALRMLARTVMQLLKARRNNDALLIQNQFLAMAEQAAGMGHWSVNLATDEIIWSDEIYTIHGVTPETYTPELSSAIDFYHPEDRDIVEKHIKRAIEQNEAFDFVLRIIQPNGTLRYVHSKGECKRDDVGEPSTLFGIFQDVTEQMKAEAELRLSRERLNLALQGGEIGFWDWSLKNNKVEYSEHWAGMLGYVSSELPQDFSTWQTLCIKEDLEQAQKQLEGYLAGETERYEVEVRMKHKDGSIRWVLTKGIIADIDNDGKPTRAVGIHIDITDRKRTENSIEESRAFLQMIIDANPDFVFVKDHKFRIIQANPAFLSIYPEHIRDKIIGTTTAEEYEKHEADKFLEQDRIAFEQGRSEIMETITFPDGDRRTLYSQKIRFTDANGEHFILCVSRDISELKQMQASLAGMGRILENSLDEVFIFERPTLKFVYANKGAQDNLGYSLEEFRMMNVLDIAPRYAEEDYRLLLSPLDYADTKKVTIQTEHIRKNGTIYEAEIHLQADYYEGKEVYVANVADVTERIYAEREREALINRLTDSNEELERFAYICSHDLQEPLRMIRSFSERLEAHLGDIIAQDERASKYFHFMNDGAKRSQEMISDILLYSSLDKDVRHNDIIDLNEVLKVVQHNLDIPLQNTNSKLIIHDLPTVRGNKTQLYQLFLNLISNGLKYQSPDNQPIVEVGFSEMTDQWEFYVKDNGIGIEKQHMHKIFDVFQRLHRKDQYKGTGVGLSICKKVVERHNGIIWVDSTPNQGTTFYFRLPKETFMGLAA